MADSMADRVEIFEVGPRDGLQNEKRLIPTAEKIALIDSLSGAGFSRIEVASFVSPKWLPQMADGDQVLAGINRARRVSYAGLVPNMRGLERAIDANVDEIAIFASASEGFSRANLNCSISDSLRRFEPVVRAASARNMKVRGYVSCVAACPFDGPTAPEQVVKVARALDRMGCYEISLGDTLGCATPDKISAMLKAVLAEIPVTRLAGHFHDTDGRALDNIGVALDLGLRVFDAAIGGLGGCPYAPGAPGNVATESVVEYLRSNGFQSGLDMDVLATAREMAGKMRSG